MSYLYLHHNSVEKEFHTVPEPVEVAAQVGDLGAFFQEVSVVHLALLQKRIQMMTEVLS